MQKNMEIQANEAVIQELLDLGGRQLRLRGYASAGD